MTTDPALLDARAAFDRSAWNDAYAGLTEADGRSPLASEDLERLAIAAHLTGRPDDRWRPEHEPIWRRSGRGHRLAVRSRVGLGMSLMQRGEMAQAGGWLAARRDSSRRRLRRRGARDPADPGGAPGPDGRATRPKRFEIFEQVAAIAERFDDAT